MAQVKNFVAGKMDNGYSVKDILAKIVKKEDYTKWDVVKAFLWWCWFKIVYNRVTNFIMDYAVRPILKWGCIGLAIVAMILIFCMSIVVLAAWGLLSPVWYSLMIWLSPAKAADLIIDERDGEDEKRWLIFDLPYSLASNIIFTVVMPLFWIWVWSLLPMNKQKFYIDANPTINIKDLDIKTQIAYYNEQNAKGKCDILKSMSREAKDELWKSGDNNDKCNILVVDGLSLEWCINLCSDEQTFHILKNYCNHGEFPLNINVQKFLLEQFKEQKDRHGYELLKACCSKGEKKDRILDNSILLALIEMLASPVGEKAEELLTLYWEKCTLPAEVVKTLIDASTDEFIDDKKTRAYSLLMKVVRRDGITPEMAAQFYERCDGGAQEQEMDYLIKMHMDFQIIDWQYINAENEEHVKKLKQYFNLRELIAPEAQSLMREWQYRIFHDTRHELDEKVLNELLVKHLQEKDRSYFKDVFAEGIARDVIADTTIKLLMMVPWKRQIVLNAWEAEKAKQGIALV